MKLQHLTTLAAAIAAIIGISVCGCKKEEPEIWETQLYEHTKIAFVSVRDNNLEIYVMNVDGSNQRRLTNNRGIDVTSSGLLMERR